MTQLINAGVLLDTIESIDWYHLNQNGEMVHGANSFKHQPWYKSDDIFEAIRNAPIVDAIKTRWIPITERLPETLGHYIITVRFNGEIFITADDYFSYGWDDWGDYVLAWLETDLKPYDGKEA